ncbi:hypothetical protein [Infirmifilum sp.]|uniref:hypothetical protein n=1 Tax=Infirmifilum sp. TaxID=2856575 RepID=UPI003D13DF90
MENISCREALYGSYNLAILESLQRRGKAKIVAAEAGLIIYKPAPDLSFEDILAAVREAAPWLDEEHALRDAALFWSTSAIAPYARVKCPEEGGGQ